MSEPLDQYDRWRTMPDTMTPEDALTALAPLERVTDIEVAHIQADDILRAVLRHLGHSSVVAAYDRVSKWYA